MLWMVTILFTLFCGGICVTCPPKQYIEKMGNETIICDVGAEIKQCYWYLGPPASTRPILKLENGIKGGAKLKDAHYDISADCEMKITEAEISHDATYTYVAFFSNGSVWRQDVSVIITVTPRRLFPRVATCTGRNSCTLTSPINETGKLTCYIDGIRPAALLYWQYEGNINVISNKSQSDPSNLIFDTWNSTATIEYSLECDEEAWLYCCSKGGNLPTIEVKINSETCNDMSIDTSEESWNTFKKLCWILTGLLVTIGAITLFIFRLAKRSNKESNGTLSPESVQKELKKIYSDYLIPGVENVYTSCGCRLAGDDERLQNTNSDKLVETSFLSENSRVLFIGNPGYGKTFFFQHLLHKWIQGDAMQDVILIYFQLKCLSRKSDVLKEIREMLQRKCKSVYDLNNVLKEKRSLFLLDGLNNLLDVRASSDGTDQSVEMDESVLTVNDLLQNEIRSFSKINVWVTSRPIEYEKIFSTPHRWVKLTGFNSEQKDKFLEQTIEHYNASNGNNIMRCSSEVVNEEEDSLISDNFIKTIKDAWLSCYGSTAETKEISPLVVHLFALNFLKLNIGEARMLPSSISPCEILWDISNTPIELSQIDWYLFACLFESSSQKEWKQLQIDTLFRGKDVVFEKGKCGYHRDAVTTLCMVCRELDVELNSLTFCKDYPTSLDKVLPKVKKELIFKKVRQDKEDLITRICSSSERIKAIRFIDCRLPTKFTLEEVDETTLPKVLRGEGEQTYFFEFKKNIWIKEIKDTSQREYVEDTCETTI